MDNVIHLYILNIHKVSNFPESYFISHFPLRYERAKRFKFEEDRLRSLGAGILISDILKVSEDEIKLESSGKPYILDGPNFNISHSGDFVILAVSNNLIGVDIEKIDRRHLTVAKRVLRDDELIYVEDNERRFFILWTLKEGVSKALGLGLSMDYRKFSVLPLTEGNSININDRTLYGTSIKEGEYIISLASDKEIDKVEVEYR